MSHPPTCRPVIAALLLGLLASGCGEDVTTPPGADRAPPPAADPPPSSATPAASAAAPSTVQPPVASLAAPDLARQLLERSTPQNQYSNLPEPVWRARLALKVALADQPLTALDGALENANARYSGFGAGAKRAQVMGQIALVAHHLGNTGLETAALAHIETLGKAAFDQEETDAVRGVALVTLARMAHHDGSPRAAEFEQRFRTMLGDADAEPLTAWADLIEYYYHRPDAERLARMVVEGRAEMDAVRINGRPSTVLVMQRLGFWRSWNPVADIVEAFPDERLQPWQTLARWAVEAELDGDPVAADRLAALAEARHRALNRDPAEVQADAEAVRWMREHLTVSDPAVAKAMFNDNPDITAQRRAPGTTTLSGLKREVVAAAMMRAGFSDRGYELVGSGRGNFSMPAVVFSAVADAGMWGRLLDPGLRFGLPQQLLIYGTAADKTGWPDRMAAMSRQALDAGESDAARRVLIGAAGGEPHPGNRAVARELRHQFDSSDALRQALEQTKGTLGTNTGPSFELVNALVLEGMGAEQVMRSMGTYRLGGRRFDWDNLGLVPEFGTALAYGAVGLPKLWW